MDKKHTQAKPTAARRCVSAFVRSDSDGPLSVGVEGKELVIRIGVDRLAFCLRTNIGKAEGCKIRSKYDLAKDISAEMERDDGSGGCKLWDFIDQMAVITAENGGAISLPNT